MDSEKPKGHDQLNLKELNNVMRREAAGVATRWYDLGLELLDSNTAVLDVIQSDHQSDNARCSKMFKAWLEMKPDASWSQLVTALSNIGLNTPADNVRHSKMSKEADDDQPTKELSETETLLHFNVRVITRLNGNYAKVVNQIMNIIDKKKLDIKSLIINLCACDTTNLTVFSTDEAFVKITNTIELFHEIMKYCTMYDYELLLALAISIGCEESMKLLDDFTEQLKHSVLQNLDLLPELKHPKILPGTHKLIIKYIGGTCTLQSKKLIQNVVYECFHLKKVSLIFRGAEEGCIAFVFQISSAVKSYLLQYKVSTEDVAVLSKHKITHILIDKEELIVITNNQKRSECDQLLLMAWLGDIIKENSTALHLAAEGGHVNIVEALISSGAAVNALDKRNWTAVHFAARSARAEVVKTLIISGAKVNACDMRKRTALHLAAEGGHVQVVETLIRLGADVNALDEWRKTALHDAAECGHVQVIETLIRSGAKVNTFDMVKWTTLHLAAGNGHVQVVKTLVKSGANVNVHDKYRRTPLQLALLHRRRDVVQFLMKVQ
ncbi:uncharacterized protein [Dysidea avara]|uniref:uncharacterized protein isoform X2 n=1 Tax=Dysidea avara TaxID=196820 RepID=UPI003329CD40